MDVAVAVVGNGIFRRARLLFGRYAVQSLHKKLKDSEGVSPSGGDKRDHVKVVTGIHLDAARKEVMGPPLHNFGLWRK